MRSGRSERVDCSFFWSKLCYNPHFALFLLSLVSNTAIKTDSYDGEAISCASSKLWNSMPEHIKKAKTVDCFKAKLKTFLLS